MEHIYITWSNDGLLSIVSIGTNFSEIRIKTQEYSFDKIHLKKSCVICWSNCSGFHVLTHWGRVTHICVRKLTIFGSDNGLSPGRRWAITWTNAHILSIQPLGTTCGEIWNTNFSFKKTHLKTSSAKWRPFCPGGDELTSFCLVKPNKIHQSSN